MDVEVLNFGCRLNIAEGEAIRAAAHGAPLGNTGGLIIVNSCAVTAEAERQARQAIRKAARLRPDARIVLTGCGADVSRARFAAMPEVSDVVPNGEKLAALSYDATSINLRRHPSESGNDNKSYTPLTSGATHARAFVSVQTGCDHRCTFCIIPYGRGDSRSARVGDVIAACAAAVARGQQEVVLTGVDLTSYDDDGQPLGSLVEAILTQVPALPRLRLSSLDSVEIDPLLEEIITSEPRLMPHLHLSLQAGDDMILKRMKRRHSRTQAVALVQRLKTKRPELSIGADIIAGFPTEDEAMFANSLALVEDCDLVFGHVFPYSPREGTPAARMPQVAPAVAKARAATLRDAIATRKAAWLNSLVGTTQQMLVELDGLTGHIANFAAITLDQAAAPKSILPVIITLTDGARLYGAPA
jgi:threonylcarbamoyladenosine tRNA methylthiotransferase MtaB